MVGLGNQLLINGNMNGFYYSSFKWQELCVQIWKAVAINAWERHWLLHAVFTCSSRRTRSQRRIVFARVINHNSDLRWRGPSMLLSHLIVHLFYVATAPLISIVNRTVVIKWSHYLIQKKKRKKEKASFYAGDRKPAISYNSENNVSVFLGALSSIWVHISNYSTVSSLPVWPKPVTQPPKQQGEMW